MLDHLLIYVAPELMEKTVGFYLATLAPLGYTKVSTFMDGAVVGMGDGSGHPDFWVASASIKQDQKFQPGYAHFAFTAKGRTLVEECYSKGLEAGGTDNGAPGARPMYTPDYYGAFLLDPAGNGMEIVNRTD